MPIVGLWWRETISEWSIWMVDIWGFHRGIPCSFNIWCMKDRLLGRDTFSVSWVGRGASVMVIDCMNHGFHNDSASDMVFDPSHPHQVYKGKLRQSGEVLGQGGVRGFLPLELVEGDNLNIGYHYWETNVYFEAVLQRYEHQ
jgi:hypothetical protein